MSRRSRKARRERQLQKKQASLLWLLRVRGLDPGVLGHASPTSDDDPQQAPAPPRPDAVGGDWSDRSVPAPPRRTFDLVLRNKTEPELAATGGPVRRLTSLAADVVARHLDAYDQTIWNDGPEGLSIELARHVVLALQSEHRSLDRASWVAFVGGYGPAVLPPARIEPGPIADGSRRPVDSRLTLNLPYAELLHTLRSAPPTCDLLRLNGLAHFAEGGDNVLTQLDLSHTTFSDADCKAIKDLCFLRALSTERTLLTDAGVRFLTSALYTEAESSNADSTPMRRGLHNLRAWSLRDCVGVTDRAAVSLRSWPGLCYIDVRQSSATPSAFIQILNRRSEEFAPSASISATKFALLACPPDSTATLLDLLLASPDCFPFLPPRSSAAVCTITTKSADRNTPTRSRSARAPKSSRCEAYQGDDDIERPVGLVPTPIGSTQSSDIVFVRRSASTAVQVRLPTLEDMKRKVSADAEVARVKKRRADGPSSDPTAGLLGVILGHSTAAASSPVSATKGISPSRVFGTQPGRSEVRRPASQTPTARSTSALPPPVAISARPFQPSTGRRTPAAAASSSGTRSAAQPTAVTADGFAAKRPPAQVARIGDGGRALKGTGSIFRGAKWS